MAVPVIVKKKAGRAPLNLQQLETQVADLETRAAEVGVTGIEAPDAGIVQRVFRSPVVRTIVDVISRPGYASAGFAEELLGHGSLSGAVARAGREIFSGLGDIQGDKETFGEVLEQAGWGTTTLSDLAPMLEGTWVGNFGSRGAAGLALDIALDPLTYVTFGASAGAKTGFKSGVKYLSREGVEELAKVRGALRSGYKSKIDDAIRAGDDAKIVELERALDDEAGEEFLKRWTTQTGDLPARLADPRGIKFMGASVIPGKTLAGLSADTADLLTKIPGGQWVMESTGEFSHALGDAAASLLSPFAALRPLKFKQPGMYDRAVQLHRDTTRVRARIHARYHGITLHGNEKLGIAPGLRDRFRSELKKDELFGNKLYSVRYGTPDPTSGKSFTLQDLTPGQAKLFAEYNTLTKWARETLVDHGIFTAKELPDVYYPVRYQNVDELSEVHALNPRALDASRVSSSFLRERMFDNPWEAVQVTKKSREMAQRATLTRKQSGLPSPAIRPELNPNFNLQENMDAYFAKYADAIARNSWNERIVSEFGVPITDVIGAGDIWDHKLWQGSYSMLPVSEMGKISQFFQGGRQVSPIDKGWKELLEDEIAILGKKGKRTKVEASLMARAEQTLAGLSPRGQQVFVQRLLSAVHSEAQATTIALALGDKFPNAFPRLLRTSDEAASVSYGKMYGEGAKHAVVRSSTITGGKPYLIPEFLIDDLTRINRDVLLSPKNKELHRLVRAYDKVTALARLGVYGAWIPSALRDAYNNVALGMFDVGLSMADPTKVARAVGFLAGRKGVLRTVGGDYTYDELREMAQAMGVVVPGRVFAEQSLAGRGRVQQALEAFAEKRGSVENAGRVQLWLNNIERGVSPREAANHVTDFLFDYGEVSPFFRSFMKRAFFFPTFTMKNIPFWARELRRNPGLAVNQLKPFRGRNSEEKEMASWQADQLRFRIDRDGKTIHVLTGIDLPITNLDTLWGGGFGKTGRRFLSMMAPIPRTLQEQVSGTNLLTGRPLSRTQSQTIGRILDTVPTPRGVKNWLGYAKDVDAAGRPTYSFDEQAYALLVRSWMFSRVVSSSDRAFRDILDSDTSTLQGLIDSAVTGIRYNEIDLEEARKQKIRGRVQALREAIQRRGYRAGKPERELE